MALFILGCVSLRKKGIVQDRNEQAEERNDICGEGKKRDPLRFLFFKQNEQRKNNEGIPDLDHRMEQQEKDRARVKQVKRFAA